MDKPIYTSEFKNRKWIHYRNGEKVMETNFEIDLNTAPRDRFPFIIGESDAITKQQKAQYEKNFKDFIAALREQTKEEGKI